MYAHAQSVAALRPRLWPSLSGKATSRGIVVPKSRLHDLFVDLKRREGLHTLGDLQIVGAESDGFRFLSSYWWEKQSLFSQAVCCFVVFNSVVAGDPMYGHLVCFYKPCK
jgi:hypothetical protein